MRNFITLILLFLSFTLLSQVNPNYHKVKGYYRKDGTYVKPHYRTNPNNTNRDNYTTKPNKNPHTGKRGYISPDNKSKYYPKTTTYNNYSNRTSVSNSFVSFYTNYGSAGSTEIWINNSYKGKLNSYFSSGKPLCGENGTLKIPLSPGTYSYRAVDQAGFYWEGTFTTVEGNCESLILFSSAESRFNLGFKNGKENYETSTWNYLVPFTFTAFNPYLGAGTTLTINLFPPSHYKSGDRNFDRGFRKVAYRKKIITTVVSFGLGLITHELIGNELKELNEVFK